MNGPIMNRLKSFLGLDINVNSRRCHIKAIESVHLRCQVADSQMGGIWLWTIICTSYGCELRDIALRHTMNKSVRPSVQGNVAALAKSANLSALSRVTAVDLYHPTCNEVQCKSNSFTCLKRMTSLKHAATVAGIRY